MNKKTNFSNANLVFEELEPRLLLSADGLGVITESSVATVQALVQHQNENIIIVQQQTEQPSTVIQNNVQSDSRSELVIIDSRAPNFQQLHNDIIKAQQQGRDINVVILDSHRDGVEQISEALSKYNKLDAVHIVSHGKDGQLQLGATQLNNQNLKQYNQEINKWKQVFTGEGDLLIYGCNLAGSSNGTNLVNSLSSLTGADVAASDDVTGNNVLGGDWDLEYQTGEIETKIAFTADLQDNWQGTLNADAQAAEQTALAEEEQVQTEQEAIFLAESEAVLLAEEQEAEVVVQEAEQEAGIVEEQRLEIVFIDESVDDYQAFIDDINNNNDTSINFEIILLDNERNGIEQISETLSTFGDVDAVHILSHGSDGTVKLGNTWLSDNNINEYSDSIGAWGSSLDENADILIYGCNLADSETGEQFVNQLAQITGADVAASDDVTGSALLGGDWRLEYQVGTIEAQSAVSAELQQSYTSKLAAETVADDLSTGDFTGNTGSQSWADDGDGDDYWIEVDGAGVGAGVGNVQVSGGEISIRAAGSSVARQVDLSGATSATFSFDYHTGSGIEASDPDSFVIEVSADGGDNWIILEDINYLTGANSGSKSYDISAYMAVNTQIGFRANAGYGGPDEFFYIDNVQIDYIAVNKFIVSTTADSGAGSLRQAIIDANATTNLGVPDVITFDIGADGSQQTINLLSALDDISESVDIDGFSQYGALTPTAPVIEINGAGAGATSGLTLVAGSDGSTIQGLVINQFTESGIELDNSDNNLIVGNYIGTDATGTVDLGNTSHGIFITNGSSGNTIGGSTAALSNVIAGNDSSGVSIRDAGSDDNIIIGNYIGTDVTGTLDLGNVQKGIQIQLNANNNRIGGTTAGEGNTIAYNDLDGIRLLGSVTGTSILGNSIHSNDLLGINFWNGGSVTLNDVGDADTGANNLQNFPVFNYANTDGVGNIALDGTLNTDGLNQDYRIEFFASTTADASGYGEAERYLGFATVTTDGSGNAIISTTLSATVAANEFITATATVDFGGGNYGDTSEFAQNISAVTSLFIVTTTADSGLGSLRQAIIDANATANMGVADVITFDIAADGSQQIITLLTALDSITEAVIIDGFTQYGALSPTAPLIEINGSATTNSDGFYLAAGSDGSTIQGLIINNFDDDGIKIYSDNNVIAGNYIGTNAAGTADQGNGKWGIEIFNSSGNTIGGTTDTDRNVISGNDDSGIILYGASTTGNTVQGNYIGTNAAGTAAIANTNDGIAISTNSSGNTIGGTISVERNVISGNGADGIYIEVDATNNTVSGNYIGTDATGLVALGNARFGVTLYSGASGNTIGGTAAGAGNVISANTDSGIVIDGAGGSTTDNNLIQGNYIGTDKNGTADLGNGGKGVHLFNGADTNTIGGTTAGAGNVISGNSGAGVYLEDAGTDNNVIQGNFIGTDNTGTVALGNSSNNVNINSGASNNTVGGSVAGAGNVIADSANDGITIWGGSTTGNTVQGNYIGTDTSGTIDLGNANAGVVISGGANNTLIGGTGTNDGNVVAFNNAIGVEVRDFGSVDNTILGNSIYSNTLTGIDLGGDGVTANDAGDGDSGVSNNLQNFPVLTTAATNGVDSITIDGAFNSTANSYYRIEFFASSSGDATGYGEGETYLGFANITTDGSGNATINAVLSASVADGAVISATATKSEVTYTSFTDTSEFALNIVATDTATILDDFDSATTYTYGDNDGTVNWSGDWVDTDADGLPTGGEIRVNASVVVSSGDSMRIRARDPGISVTREADLSSASSATFSFDYDNVTNLDSGTGSVAAQVSSDGGGAWNTLETFYFDGSGSTSGSASYDITAYASANTQVRFAVISNDSNAGTFYVDDVQIEYTLGVVNNAPEAVNDTFTTDEDTPLVINPTANDTDADGDAISVVEFTQPANGTVVDNGDGTFTYTPDSAYTGADSFDYVAIDTGSGLQNYWGLDGDAVAAVGGIDGTLNGTTTIAGSVGNGLGFNESSDYVQIPDVTYGSEFTISFDFKIDDNTGSLFQYIYSHGDINSFNSINVFLNEASHGTDPNELRTVIRDANDTLDNFALQTNIASLIGDGQWHTYTVTAGANGLEVFIDGVSVAADATRGVDGVNPTTDVYLGAKQDLDTDRHYGGELDSVKIYDNALSSAQVADLSSENNRATVSITVDAVNDAPLVSDATTIFINEIHYDNSGTDAGEAIEIAGSAGQDLSGWNLVLYNGSNNLAYTSTPLSGTFANQNNGMGVLTFNYATNGIQNDMDGIALVDASGNVVQFISYEGSFTAIDGPAAGMTSTDIGVAESSTTPVGYSLQLNGTGASQTWSSEAASTFGSINTTQDFTGALGTLKPESVIEDNVLLMNAANGNLITVFDVDAGAASVLVTLSVSNGTLTLGSTLGLSGLSGDGTSNISFSGSVADVNTSLEGLTYQGVLNYSGSDTLTVFVDDQGNTGSGGNLTFTATKDITVNGVNDAPSGTDKTITVTEDTDYVFTTADFGFTDVETDVLLNVIIATAPSNGILYLDDNLDGIIDGGETLIATDVVAVADITAGKLKFQPVADANGTAYDSFTFQVQDDGGVANSGVDTDQSANIITIDVTGVNDAPVLDLDTNDSAAAGVDYSNTWTQGGGSVLIADTDAVLSDVDSANLTSLTVTLTNLWDGADEILSADTSGTSITANYVSATGVLTLSGSDTVANYQQVLRTISYNNTHWAPVGETRVIEFVANDGTDNSLTATTNLTMATDFGVLVVTNTSDAIGGDTSSIDALIASDGGDGISLREAIIASNNTANGTGPDVIRFDVSGAGPHIIALSGALPNITDTIIIDGTSEPDFAGTPMVVLDGSGAGAVNGLTLTAGSDGSTIRGLVINQFGIDGIYLNNSDNNTIVGNYIGTDVTGSVAQGNSRLGILIDNGASNNTIGGLTAADRNVISGNGQTGIHLEDVGTTGNTIIGNYLGVAADGTSALGNIQDGIKLFLGASNNTIGGTAVGAGNVIGANGQFGVFLQGAGVDNNIIQGNFIGTDASGAVGLGNAGAGIFIIDGADSNSIGGSVAGAGNVVSANGGDGITVDNASNTIVLGNLIGTNAAGTAVLGNAGDGVRISSGSTNNTIGGTTVNERNIISGNGLGVWIVDAGTTLNTVQGNYIGTDITGLIGLGNLNNGIGIANGASNNTIGGSVAGAGNVISDNATDGIRIDNAANNAVLGNLIGTNATGTAALGNADDGIQITNGATNNTIGGTTANERNIISGNVYGIWISDATTTGNTLIGNYIGTDITGAIALGNTTYGVVIAGASSNTIGGSAANEGNVISASGNDGIHLDAASNNNILGNIIGLNAAGTAALANGDAGIEIQNGSSNNIIGGTTANERNVISGNVYGIWIGDAGSTGNTVQGNYIGTDVTGLFVISNSSDGISINTGASGSIIGGSVAGAGNVISGNGDDGIEINSATGISVIGNIIGLNADGTAALGNGDVGVQINDSDNIIIGGTTASERNIISSNNWGIWITGASSTNVTVSGNYIGTDITGSIALGNTIGIEFATGAFDNMIGGDVAGAGNLITASSLNGVKFRTDSGDGNAILGNTIYANTDIGIDLNSDGVTLNDVGDVDSGANELQNFAVISSAITDGAGTIQIDGLFNSNASTTYRIEFFASATADGSGYGEAERYLGFATVTTDGSGNATISETVLATVAVGEFVTATATVDLGGGNYGSTSEFSLSTAAIAVNTAPVAVDDRTALDFDGIDDHVLIANDPALVVTTNLTIEAWINPNTVSAVDDIIVNKEGEYELSVRNGTIQWGITNTDPGWTWYDTGYAVTANTWTHVAFTYDNGIANTYINGVLVDSYSGSGVIGDTYPALNDLVIGGRSNSPAGKYFDGQIADVRIWNTTRTALQISSNLSTVLASSEPGLVGYWLLDEGTGTTAVDSSVQGNDGLLGGGVAAQEPSWADYTIAEDGTLNVTAPSILANDFDVDGDTLTVNTTAIVDVSNGTLTLSSDGSFIYIADTDFNGIDSFTYEISDGNGGVDTAVVTINVTPVNDAPVLTNGGNNTANEGSANAPYNGATLSDVDSSNFDGGVMTFSIASGSDSKETLFLSTFGGVSTTGSNVFVSGVLVGTFTGGTSGTDLVITFNTDATVARVQNIYQALAIGAINGEDDPTTGVRTLEVVLTDGDGGTSNTATASVTINAINDDPVNSGSLPASVTIDEDQLDQIDLSAITINDPDENGGLLTMTFTTGINGNLWLAGGVGITSGGSGTNVVTITGTQTDINTYLDVVGNFSYSNDITHVSGLAADSIQVDITDNGNTGTGGSGVITLGNIAVDITPVNDAPTASNLNAAESYTEQLTLDLIDIVVSDVDSVNTIVTLTLSDVSAGNLSTATSGLVTSTFIGGVWTASGAIVDVNTLLAGVTFTPAVDYANNFTIATSVDDGVASVVTGVKIMTAVPVNDAPEISTPLTESTPIDTALVFSVANGNSITVTDIDAGAGLVELTLNVNDGTLTLAGFAGLTFSVGDGSADSTMTFTGTLTDVNNALDGLSYDPTTSFNGNSVLQINVDDLGNTGSGNVLVDSTSINIAVGSFVPLATDDPGDYNSAILALNPLSYWRLGETSGTGAADGGSSTNAGTYTNGVTLGQAGVLNGDNDTAAYLDGIDDYVLLPQSNDYLLDSGTVQFWFNADSIGSKQALFSKDHTGFGTGGHLTIWLTDSGTIETRLQSTSGNNLVETTTTVAAGEWHHVSLSFGANGMELYLDGQLADVNGYTGGLATTSGGSGNIEPILLGASAYQSTAGLLDNLKDFFQGSIDEVSLLGNQLTAEQIQNIYASGFQNYTLAENTSLNVVVSEGVLINDSDTDGDPLTAVLVSGPSFASSFTLNADGSFDYTPTAGFDGIDTFTYRANDGVNNSNIATVTITVTGFNDAPTATNLSAAETYIEDTSLNLIDIVVTDVDDVNTTVTLTLSDVAAGSLTTATSGAVTSTFAGGVWTASGAVTDVNTLLAGVTFNPALNYDLNFTIATSVDDGVASAVTGTKIFTAAPVNDAPVLDLNGGGVGIDYTTTFVEGGAAANVTGATVSLIDVDNTNLTSIVVTLTNEFEPGNKESLSANVGATTLTAIWDGTANTLTISGVGTVADYQSVLATVSYDNTSNNPNATDRIITFVANDGADNSLLATTTVNFTAVNNAPTATNLSAAETYVEDTSLSLVDIVVADVDSVNVTVTLTFSDVAAGSLSTATSGAVTSTFVGGVWTASGAIVDVNSLLAGVTFNSALNYDINFSIATSVDDGIAPAVIGTKVMTASPINDAPVNVISSTTLFYSAATGTIAIDPTLTITDVDSANLTSATIWLASGHIPAEDRIRFTDQLGITGSFNATTGIMTLTGTASVADYQTALRTIAYEDIVLTPAQGTLTINFTVSDGSLTSIIDTRTITVVPNASPNAVNDTAVVNEGNTVIVNVAGNDSDSEGALDLGSIVIVSPASNGSLVVNGDGTVTYTHNGSETISDTFTYTISDAPGFVSSVATVNITINPVNDAPTATNLSAGEAYIEDNSLNLIDIVVTDVDNTNTTVTLTLSDAGAGTLSTATSGLVTSTFVGGVWTASGAVADVNVLLAGVTFNPTLNYNSNFNIATSVDDGIAPAVTGSKLFVATPVNDPAIIAGVDTGAVTEDVDPDVDTLLETAGTLTVSDVDAGEASFTAGTIIGTYGDITIDAAGNWTYAADNTQAVIQNLAAGASLTDTISVTSFDGTSHNIVITINGANDAAVIAGLDTGAVTEDIDPDVDTLLETAGTLTVSDTDTGEASFTAGTVIGTYGDITIDVAGNWTYAADNTQAVIQNLAAGASLTDTISVTSFDGTSHNIVITINGANDAAVIAGVDTGAVTEDIDPDVDTLLETAGTLTVSDTDTGEAIFTAGTVIGTYGDITIDAAGNWTYAADNTQAPIQALAAGATLTDTISITSFDGTIHNIVITINGANDAAVIAGVDTSAVTEDVDPDVDTLLETAGVLTITDTDTGEAIFTAGTIIGTYGDITIDAAGNWTYAADNTQAVIQTLAAGATLTDTINITSFDGTIHNIVITINGANDAAVISGVDTGAVTEDVDPDVDTLLETAGTLNITDIDTGEASFTAGTIIGTYGDITIDAAGNWTYAADNTQAVIQNLASGVSLTDTISVTSIDGATHNIVITINGANDAAVIGGVDIGAVTEDVDPDVDTLLETAGALTITDTDTGEASFSGGIVSGTYGDITLNTTGNWTYAADNTQAVIQNLAVGASLTDTISVTSFDGTTHNIVITINGANDAAVIGGVDTGAITEDVDPDVDTLLETAGALTITDADTGEASFTAGIITGTYGDITIDVAGNWTYAADNTQAVIQNLAAGASLTDTISVTSFDGTTHNIVITIGGVNDLPVAVDDNTTLIVDEGAFAVFDLAVNDFDIDNALDLNSITITGAPPVNGTLVVNGDGTVTYTHDGSETLSDSFTYTIADISGAISNTATVDIIVNAINDAPIANDDNPLALDEGATATFDLALNDFDAEGALDLNSINIIGGFTTANGFVSLNGDGTVTYTHNGSETSSDSFTYTIFDTTGVVSNTATVNIVINPVNDTPTTIGITNVTVDEDDPATTINLNTAFNDADNLDSELTYSVIGNTSLGLFASTGVNATTGELVLDYAADMNGTSNISIRAMDPSGAFVDTLFTVTVTPINDAPVLPTNNTLVATGSSSINITNAGLNITDVDNTNIELTYTLTSPPSIGVLSLNGNALGVGDSFTQDDIDNNRLSYMSSGAGIFDQFSFTVSDGAGGLIGSTAFNISIQVGSPPPTEEPPPPEPPVDPPIEPPVLPPAGPGPNNDYNPIGTNTVPPQPVLTTEPVVQPPLIEQPVTDDEVKLKVDDFTTVRTYADIQVKAISALWTAIDQMKQEMSDDGGNPMSSMEFRSAAVSSTGVGLTAGVVAWVLRSGALMTSLLSTIPLWKGYDPLPLLAYKNDDEKENAEISEDKIPTSLEEVKKIKALKEKLAEKMAKQMKVDSMFSNNNGEQRP